MFSFGRIPLSHPSFSIRKSDAYATELLAELVKSPHTFQYRSKTCVVELDEPTQVPGLAVRSKTWGIELLAVWSTAKLPGAASVFELRLPLDPNHKRSLPSLGDMRMYSSCGFLISFRLPSSAEQLAGKALIVRLSELTRRAPPTFKESFAVARSPNGGWQCETIEVRDPRNSVERGSAIFEGALPPRPV